MGPRLISLPRSPSLELYVLPIGGGHYLLVLNLIGRTLIDKQVELTGIEPVTSAVRLQRSPS